MQEVHRLKEADRIGDDSWEQICQMGRDLALDYGLFTPPSHAEIDRRRQDRRVLCRRIKVDRRQQVRRASKLAWLGLERRRWERRRHIRRTKILSAKGKSHTRESPEPGYTCEPGGIPGIEVQESTMSKWIELCNADKKQTLSDEES